MALTQEQILRTLFNVLPCPDGDNGRACNTCLAVAVANLNENTPNEFDSGWTTALMLLDNWIRQNTKESVTTKAIRQELINLIHDGRPHGTYPPEVWAKRNV
jgi:hypothetical protein